MIGRANQYDVIDVQIVLEGEDARPGAKLAEDPAQRSD
jgi:hypothetical protein